MGRGQKPKSKEKKEDREKKRRVLLACKERIHVLNMIPDFLVDFVPFHSYVPRKQSLEADKKNHLLEYKLKSCAAKELCEDERDSCFKLFEDNMKEMYVNSSWGHDPVGKRNELFDHEARYIVATDVSNAIVGFVHFRFCIEADEIVLYIYEIQIAGCVQRIGLGKRLMQVLELIARKYKLSSIMLTVFKKNTAAMQFYTKKMGFTIDESSPSSHNIPDECYEILSKCFTYQDTARGQ